MSQFHTLKQVIKFSLLSIISIGFISCTSKVNPAKSEVFKQVEMSYSKACASEQCPCESPLGPIVDGGTAIAYSTAQVTCGETCETKQIKLTCKNGHFDKEIQNLSFSCQVNPCKSCVAGNSQVSHGFTVQMYNTSSVACGKSCDDFKRPLTCKDGQLFGQNDSASSDGKDSQYKFASCINESCSCSIASGGKMTVGGTMKYYKSATGSCDIPCEDSRNMLKRTCTVSGNPSIYSFNGDSSFDKPTCSEKSTSFCNCKLPDTAKTILIHGASQDLYSKSSPDNCNTCTSTGFKITVYCDSGTLYNKPANDSSRVVYSLNDLNSHSSLTCDPLGSPDCFVNNNCIAHKTSLTLYNKTSLSCNDNPTDASGLFSCNSKNILLNGTAYNSSVDSFKTVWQKLKPTSSCQGCNTPWGLSVGTNTIVNMYKSSTNSSNSCGTGCKQVQMKCQANGSFSSGDNSIDADYNLNKNSYTQNCNNSCNQEGGGAPPRLCLLPWQNSYITPDSVIPMWRKKVVEYGDSCQNYFRVGRCMLGTGTFDAGLQYIYKSCTEIPYQGLKIDSVSPKFLATTGGQITLLGAGFTSNMQIKIGKKICSNIQVSNGGNQVTCTAPNNNLGAYDVLSIVQSKKAILPNGLNYYSGTCSAGPGIQIFNYTGTDQSFVVPSGCKSLSVKIWGAGGGGRQYYAIGNLSLQTGGAGGFAQGEIPVTAGQTLKIVVGGGGAGGYHRGSNGGGYSGLFSNNSINQENALIIAGGGGGAGDPVGCNKGGTGGEGGGLKGSQRGTCSGGGGSASTGGIAGASATAGTALKGGSVNSNTSSLYAGQGSGGSTPQSGGGGGGGYFGGGAGSDISGLGGAGGGGSGYLSSIVINGKMLSGNGRLPPGTTFPEYTGNIGYGGNDPQASTGSANGGNGLIIISY